MPHLLSRWSAPFLACVFWEVTPDTPKWGHYAICLFTICMLDLLCAIFCLLSIIICIYLQVAYGVVGWGYICGVNRWWDCVWLICSHNFLLSLVLICSTFKVWLFFSSLFLFLYSCMVLNKDKKIQCLGLRFVFLVYKVLPLLRCFIGYSGQQGQCVLISLYNTRHRISSCSFLS